MWILMTKFSTHGARGRVSLCKEQKSRRLVSTKSSICPDCRMKQEHRLTGLVGEYACEKKGCALQDEVQKSVTKMYEWYGATHRRGWTVSRRRRAWRRNGQNRIELDLVHGVFSIVIASRDWLYWNWTWKRTWWWLPEVYRVMPMNKIYLP